MLRGQHGVAEAGADGHALPGRLLPADKRLAQAHVGLDNFDMRTLEGPFACASQQELSRHEEVHRARINPRFNMRKACTDPADLGLNGINDPSSP